MTLVDDDSQPGLSVSDLSLVEGDSGSFSGSVQITLSSPSASTVQARLDSADVTATAGQDYQALSSVPVVFAPGDTAVTIPVNVAGDVALEGDETFTLTALAAAERGARRSSGRGHDHRRRRGHQPCRLDRRRHRRRRRFGAGHHAYG